MTERMKNPVPLLQKYDNRVKLPVLSLMMHCYNMVIKLWASLMK